MEFTRVDSDISGNPRYVYSWLNLKDDNVSNYKEAIKKANRLGLGSKYRNKKYGGGIVVSSYNLRITEKDIKNSFNK